ncbi:serine protease 53-like isoform X2 [Armigeres subalbatus]|uniref:serine protease 53-like isoform X2 n=1 Tax=Armigeres subalbatus TaxID=124917 RepID=UPI002ED539B5
MGFPQSVIDIRTGNNVNVMKMCRIQMWIVFLLSNWLKITVGDNAFIDDPPDGYYKRTSLDDCPHRFYSEDVSSSLNFFILGGARAYRSEFPHMAAIGWTNIISGRVDYECGGSLISSRHVVTAGHCGFNDKGLAPDTVRLGDTDLGSKDDDAQAQDVKIRKFIPHPNYKRSQKYYDIAIIELESEAHLDAAVCPICLWAKDGLKQFAGGLQVAGFGVTDYASDHSPTLQKATLDYYDFDTCNRMLPRPRSLFKGLSSDQFCAKTPMKDTCQGDSGGPIQVELSDINKVIPFLVGVTSFGTGCWDGSFGIYTKISSYVEWISSISNVTVNPLECARQSECLSSRKFSDSRITPQNNSPFFRVELLRDGKRFNQCSGALIDYRHVITSASCTSLNNQQPTQILANDQSIDIIDIIRHPLFVPGKHYNDIAVLQLAKFYNPHKIYQIVAPACIWRKDKIPEPIVFYSGYGEDSSGSSSSYEPYVPLKILTAFYLDNGRCNANYSEQFVEQLPGGFNGDFVCAENPIDLVPGICRLEPGGPISNFRRDNVVPYVYGINTLGEECGGAGNLFVATRVSSYYTWIESIVLNGMTKVNDNRFDHNENELDNHIHAVVNRGDFPTENSLVSHVIPGLIASDHRLKPYHDHFVPLATASTLTMKHLRSLQFTELN